MTPSNAPSERDDPRWTSIIARDRGADGLFVYGVRTTGVFCRPSCPSRRARPENVTFHPTCEAAVAAGYRPCLRCRPDAEPATRHAALVAEACRRIDANPSPVPLAALARASGLSAFHFHRVFKAVTGLTPRGYAAARRGARVRDRLADGGGTVTDALYAAGYGASSRFYEASGAVLGMTPTAYRTGGDRVTVAYAFGSSSLGPVLVARSERGICAVLIGDDPGSLEGDLLRRFPRARIVPAGADFAATVEAVVRLIEEPGLGHDLPLDLRGTTFQHRVWEALRAIPAGSTATYAELAARLGQPTAVRAVAGACAANPVAVAVPCHRVVRRNGALSGYRWGVARKRALLAREGRADPGGEKPPPTSDGSGSTSEDAR